MILATNCSVDLLGEQDNRQDTYGRAAYKVWPLRFKPPDGQRVRINHVIGDLLALLVPGAEPPLAGGSSGVLVGLQTTAPEGSAHADLAADNTFLYRQGAITTAQPKAEIPFDFDFSVGPTGGGLLEADGVLLVKVATFLNTIGVPIHLEATFVIEYDFETAGDSE